MATQLIIRGPNPSKICSYIQGRIEARRILMATLSKLTSFALKGRSPFKTGIMQRRQPDGQIFAPLKDSTMGIRKKRGIQRGRSFILRETDTHILNQIRVLQLSKDLARIGVGETKNKMIASLQHSGFTTSPRSMVPNKKVPARAIFGFSNQLLNRFMKEIGLFFTYKA